MMLKRLVPSLHFALRRYFASGWAFLIPYQLAYLLYYWRQWPSNPCTETAAKTPIPSLLAVYWAMHAINLALGAWAVFGHGLAPQWCREPSLDDSFLHHRPRRSPLAQIRAIRESLTQHRLFPSSVPPSLIFWIGLTLLFYIPGVYLEFPADPLMHLRRITEWQVHEVVHWHTAGYKSLYFFAYSLIGWLSPGRLLFWTNIYHVAICLLLSWQYYRLARDTGLPKRWAQGFVLLHALMFGNFCFSFFRYYSLASTAFAQLGAIVLIRLAIAWVKQKRIVEGGPTDAISVSRISALQFRQLALFASCFIRPTAIHFSHFSVGLCAALLVVNNHVQGLGIAALGCASVIAWKIVRWPGPRWKGWLILASLLTAASLAVYVGWPRSPKFNAIAVDTHWLTAWQGLNFFPPDGTAYPRSIAIIGVMGVLNLLAGLYLCLRRQMIGWLTVGPILFLALPLTAVPLADNFARNGKDIITVTRMLFSIPTGLALVALLRDLTLRRRWAACGADRQNLHHEETKNPKEPLRATSCQLSAKSSAPGSPSFGFRPPFSPFTLHPSLFLRFRLSSFACLLALLFLLTVLPSSHPWQNHFWHALARPPADLSFTQESAELAKLVPFPRPPFPVTLLSTSAPSSFFAPPRIGSTTPITRLLNAQAPFTEHIQGWQSTTDKKANATEHHYSVVARGPTDDFAKIWGACVKHPCPSLVTIPATRLFTPYSQAAQCSEHWNPADALLATTGMPELETLASNKHLKPHRLRDGATLWESKEPE